MSRSMVCFVVFLAACARSPGDGANKADDTTAAGEDSGTVLELDDGDDGSTDDSGEAGLELQVPPEARLSTSEFRLKEDSCGIDEVASVESMMPTSFDLTAEASPGVFTLASDEQRTSTPCTVEAFDAETGLTPFACESFREAYRSPYGGGFDMEVSFAGEVTSDDIVAGGLTVVIHCMAGSVCDDFARSGVAFPCTVGGDLILRPESE